MAYQASRREVGMPAWLIDMMPNQNGDGAGDRRVGGDDVGHGDRHLGMQLQRLEAGRHEHEVGRPPRDGGGPPNS